MMSHDNQRRLNRQDYKTLALAALGGALEFYDFIIFVFFAAVLGDLFFPADIPDWLRQLQTFAIFAAGYLARPLGGIIMAHFGDSRGRKKMFSLSIMLMALPTLMMGLLPTWHTLGVAAPILLLLLRVLQGTAIGGEVPGAWVFVAEHVPEKRIGLACGTLTAGLTAGILLGSLVASLINSAMTPQQIMANGWRIPFLTGGVFGLFALWLRRWLHETPVFVQMQISKTLAAELPLKAVLIKHKRAVVVSMLLTWLLSAGIIVVILMAPTWLQKQHGIPADRALYANGLATAMLFVGCIIAGILADRFGASRTLATGSILFALCSWLFYHAVGSHPEMLFTWYALAGFSVGIVGVVPCILVRAFPADVRFTGISFSYNLAYAVFGGLTPICVSLLMKQTSLAPAYYVLMMAVLGLLLGLYLKRNLIGGVVATPR